VGLKGEKGKNSRIQFLLILGRIGDEHEGRIEVNGNSREKRKKKSRAKVAGVKRRAQKKSEISSRGPVARTP